MKSISRTRWQGEGPDPAVPEPGSQPDPLNARKQRPSLGALLVEAGVASDEGIKEALAEGLRSGERLGEVVVRKGWATEESLARLLAEQWQLRFMKASAVSVDPLALRQVPIVLARELGTLPIGVNSRGVVLAIAEPNHDLFAAVEGRIGEASYVVVERTVLRSLLEADPAGEPPMLAELEQDHASVAEPAQPHRREPAAGDALEVVSEPATAGRGASLERPSDPEATGRIDAATALESIDSAASALRLVRAEVATLTESLALARAKLAEREAELDGAHAAARKDREEVARLESELSKQGELFGVLRGQVATLTSTLARI